MSRGGRRAQRRKVTYWASGASSAGAGRKALKPLRGRVPGMGPIGANRLERLAVSLGADAPPTRKAGHRDHDPQQGRSETRG